MLKQIQKQSVLLVRQLARSIRNVASFEDRRILNDALLDPKDQKYLDAIYRKELMQQLRDDINYQNRDTEYNLKLDLQKQTILGQNYSLYQNNRYELIIKGLKSNDYLQYDMQKLSKPTNHKMDYEVDCIQNNKEGLIRTQRNKLLQKVKEYDYLDHQNVSVKNKFNYIYEDIDDHFSRFVEDNRYQIEIRDNELLVGNINDNVTIQKVYKELDDQYIQDIEIVYDVLNRPCYLRISTNDIANTRRKVESVYQGSLIMDEQLLDCRQKSIVVQNIDVSMDIKELTELYSQYGKIVRIEVSQMVSNQNQPSREQLIGYLNNLEFSEHQVLQIQENEKFTGRSETKDLYEKKFDLEFNDQLVDDINKYRERWDYRQSKINEQYLYTFMQRNVFECEDREAGLEGLDGHLKSKIQQSVSKQKEMNNLGYLIIEYSQKKEAQGCLLDLSLNHQDQISDLQKDKTHLHSDPFYFYQKLRRLNHLVTVKKHEEKLRMDKKLKEKDFTHTGILCIDEVYKKQPYLNPMNYSEVSNEAIQLYLGEKEFNDQNEVEMRLDEYLRDQKSLGRQKLLVDEQDIELFKDSIKRHIDDIQPGMLDSVDRKVKEVDLARQKSNSKQVYDELLRKVIQGEYSKQFIIEIFEEQMESNVVKRNVVDHVEHLELDGQQYIKNSEIDGLMESNYQNRLLTRLTKLSCKEYQNIKNIIDNQMNFYTDQEIMQFQQMSHIDRELVSNFLMKQGMVDAVMDVKDRTEEEIQEMLKVMNIVQGDKTTYFEYKEENGNKYFVRMVRDNQRIDMEKVMNMNCDMLLKQMGIEDKKELSQNLDLDSLIANIDLDDLSDQQLQQLEDELGIGVREMKALLGNEIDEQKISMHYLEKDMEMKWKKLENNDLVKQIGRGEGMTNKEGLFNQSRYRIV